MTTEIAQQFRQTRRCAHPGCVVCNESNEYGLQLDFKLDRDGAVVAEFALDKFFEGYPAMLHGGIICMILDGAMTNCLFARSCVAVTADLHVRFRHPVHTDQPASVRAWLSRATSCLYEVKAEIMQNEQIKTTAVGKFMRQNHLSGHAKP